MIKGSILPQLEEKLKSLQLDEKRHKLIRETAYAAHACIDKLPEDNFFDMCLNPVTGTTLEEIHQRWAANFKKHTGIELRHYMIDVNFEGEKGKTDMFQNDDPNGPTGRMGEAIQRVREINEMKKAGKRNICYWDDGYFHFILNFGSELLNAFKGHFPRREWMQEQKVWRVPDTWIVKVKEFCDLQGFSYDQATVMKVFGNAEMINGSLATDADLHIENIKLPFRNYQKAGIIYGSKRVDEKKGVLLADDMGVGKSCQAIGICVNKSAFPVLVVCPKKLMSNWYNEWRKFTYMRPIIVDRAMSASIFHSYDVLIINYDMVHKIKNLYPYFKAIIYDESHFLKNDKTKRFTNCYEAAQGKEVKLLLTGTPIENRPDEIIPQLRILGYLKTPDVLKKFKVRYCDKKYNNMAELNIKLRSLCMIRRKKEDILTELPPKTRQMITVEEADLTEYRMAQDDFFNYLIEMKNIKESKARVLAAAEALTQMTHLRKIAAKAKIPDVVELAKDLMDRGENVLIFAWHHEVIDALAAELGTDLIISGKISADRCDRNVRKYEDGRGQCMIIQIMAGGFGLNLVSGSYTIFAERGWNASKETQCEDRNHRIGQKKAATYYRFKIPGTIDEVIDKIIERKEQMTSEALGGNNKVENISVEKEVLAEMMRMAGAEIEQDILESIKEEVYE
jgi:SWI/SNF-related matrix-associated actin-dependent regulator of chromatin subfamily A-like protein 1